ncbi:hypothetical protein HNQ60_005055 [Povalibacter uvarum]|uniref:DUF3828 domain-containing protein n=1 Tax=Povalibacter uvarum TaxID=732238 RepID=A0A841HU49_9GAMM|nr:hypothetical protein [Povalibacter uvarum]MBB6096164.1 hypothetical protein [Povalibacter uvarum]
MSHRIVARLCVVLAASAISSVLPASAASAAEAPSDVVARLYSDFSSEVVVEKPDQRSMRTVPPKAWKKYFTKEVVRLRARVWDCEEVNGVCMIEVSPIWYSADPGCVTVRIQAGSVESVVIATLQYPVDAVGSGKAQLEYRLIRVGRHWKIDDIAYPDGSTLRQWLIEGAEE